MNNLKVLLADDHEAFRRSLVSFLRAQRGVEVIAEAADGTEAVEQTERLHPDLVLMDLEMPKRDGFEATRQIKSVAPKTRVVILSIHGGEVYRRMAWRHSADGFIDKGSMKDALRTLLLNEQSRLSQSPVNITDR